MATTQTSPKRIEPEVVMTSTFRGDSAREDSKAALAKQETPDFGKGFSTEIRYCSQTVDGIEYGKAYFAPVVTSIDGILSLAESDPIGLIKDLNYGAGLYYNSLVREVVSAENSGPAEIAKNFEKQVKSFMAARAAAGKPVSEEKARLLIKAMLESE